MSDLPFGGRWEGIYRVPTACNSPVHREMAVADPAGKAEMWPFGAGWLKSAWYGRPVDEAETGKGW